MTNDGKYWNAKNAFRKFLAVYQCVMSAKWRFFESDFYFLVLYRGFRENCCNFAGGIWVMGVRCWVMAVTTERIKSPFRGDLEGLQLPCNSAANPYQIPFRNGRMMGDKGRWQRFAVGIRTQRRRDTENEMQTHLRCWTDNNYSQSSSS